MTEIAAAQLHPPTTDKVSNRGSALSWMALAALMYLASAGVVRLFDYLFARGQMAQLVAESGPMYPVACEGCMGTPVLAALVWLTDWRALLVWSLVVGGAAAAVLISRRRSTT